MQLPMPPLNLSELLDKTRYMEMIKRVEQILGAKQRQAASWTGRDRDYYQNRCAALDQQIDALVYEWYGLTAEEIKIVEHHA